MTAYQPSTGDTSRAFDAVSRPERLLKVGINLPTTEGALAGKTADGGCLHSPAPNGDAAEDTTRRVTQRPPPVPHRR